MFDDFKFVEPLDILSAWKGHEKFGQIIVAKTKPKSIVELGTHFGFSYFVFCQTAKRLGINCSAIAVDSWKGDYQNGLYQKEYWDEVYDIVMSVNERYEDFSKIFRMTFDEAAPLIPNNSIDLLHIDGCHEYKTVSHDWEVWKPKLTENGVALFHDTNIRNLDHFGVWKFFEEIKTSEKYTFEFLHSHGLGVVAKNPEVLPEFFNINDEKVEEIRNFFQNK